MDKTVRIFQSRLGILNQSEIYICVGDCIYDEDMVQRVKLTYDNGFQVASHSWSHAHLTELNPKQGK